MSCDRVWFFFVFFFFSKTIFRSFMIIVALDGFSQLILSSSGAAITSQFGPDSDISWITSILAIVEVIVTTGSEQKIEHKASSRRVSHWFTEKYSTLHLPKLWSFSHAEYLYSEVSYVRLHRHLESLFSGEPSSDLDVQEFGTVCSPSLAE